MDAALLLPDNDACCRALLYPFRFSFSAAFDSLWISTAWDCYSHAVEPLFPRRGTVSTTPWNCESQALELRVPRRGTVSPTPWNRESQAVELRVPGCGTPSPKPWNFESQAVELRVPSCGTPFGTRLAGFMDAS